MKRRGVLLTLAASGCLGGGPFDVPPDDSTAAPPSDSTTAAAAETATARTSVRIESFAGTERCPSPGEAAVSVEGADVVVAGCVRGANGCAVPALSAAAYDAAANALTVIVGTDSRDDADACTQVRTRLGYRTRVSLLGGLPDTVSVVHDDDDGHREVVRRNVEA